MELRNASERKLWVSVYGSAVATKNPLPPEILADAAVEQLRERMPVTNQGTEILPAGSFAAKFAIEVERSEALKSSLEEVDG